MSEILIAKNIYKSYGNTPVLKNINLSVKRGEFLSIMGESGSGKSTLLSILGGNIKPDAGEVFIDGVCISSASDKELSALRRTSLGFVFQSLNLIPTLNITDNIMLPIYLHRANVSEARERLCELCEKLGISHLLSAFPEDISGGEAQRAAIARAMLHSPSVLMLDEPTGSLDSKNACSLLELLAKLNAENALTVIQVTHSNRAASYGNRTVGICDGELLSL